MCGLAGMAGNGIINQDLRVFKDLLYLASLRGEDATGVMIANTHKPNNEYAIVKEKVPSPQFIAKHQSMKQGGCLSMVGGSNLYMGHARYGTVGLNTQDNAHPFDTPKLVGMHNGTLEEWDYWWDETGRGRTDSEMMFEDMSTKGILKVLQSFSNPRSAFAITVYDKTTRKLILARNDQRPLYVGMCKNAGVMYWASEFYALHMAADRNDTKIESFFLKPHQLYEVNIDDIKMGENAPWTITPIIYDPPKKKKSKPGFTNMTDGSGWVQNHLGVWENVGGY